MRIYEYLQGILGALGVGDDNGVPTPSWRIEEYLEAIYEAIKNGGGGGGGGADLTTFLAPQFSSSTPYSAGDYVVKNGDMYKFTEDHAAGAWTGTDVEQTLTATELEALYAALANKANVDGSYSSLTAGNAEQLVSTVGVNDKTPYLFRTTGGSADVGDRVKLSEITGGTVAWNQNIKNGNFADTSEWTASNSDISMSVSDNTANVTATASGDNRMYQHFDLIEGHKYLLALSVKSANPNEYGLYWFYGSAQYGQYFTYKTASSNWENVNVIRECNGTSVQELRLQCQTATTHQYKNICLFDLTAMFGSTIADYIYSLEQNTTGAGVAWFRKLFPKDYYAYDAGSLLSVKTTAHKEYGFNAYDNTTGKAKVVGGQVYQITGTYTALSLDGSSITPDASGYFTPSASGEITVTGGNATDTCIHLKWDGERDGEYEPYEANTYQLDDVELRGIPKLDASNNLYYDGDGYASDGTVTRKYGIVDLGTLTWTTGANNCQYADLPSYPATSHAATKPNAILSNGFEYSGNAFGTGTIDKRFCFNNIKIWLYDSALVGKTITEVTNAMSGVYLVYELATPTTESADPYQETQICNDFGTEEFVDSRTVPMPVGANALYQANLRAKLEMAPDSPSGDGDYIVRQTDGLNEYVAVTDNSTISGLATRCPACPTDTDGNFVLKAVVSSGSVTYSWVAEA